jgi:RNA-binding protein Nova
MDEHGNKSETPTQDDLHGNSESIDITTPSTSTSSSNAATQLPIAISSPTVASWESGIATPESTSRVIFKILVSNNNAGSIIGKSGQTISDLQQQSSARIRLSQAGDYFPGTNDRVCLLSGTVDTVKSAISLVLEKLHQLQIEADSKLESEDLAGTTESADLKYNYSARILVPAAACGMLIGREGSTIKKIKDDACASSVRLSPKVTDHFIPRTFERILTVSGGTLESCVTFATSILDGFTRHPETCRFLNTTTSYYGTSYATTSTSPVLQYSTSPTPLQPGMLPQSPPSHLQDLDIGIQALRLGGSQSPLRPQNLPGLILSNPLNSPMTIQSPNQTSSVQMFVPNSIIGAVLGQRGQTLIDLQKRSETLIKVSQRNEFVSGTNDRIVTIVGPMANIKVARALIEQILANST